MKLLKKVPKWNKFVYFRIFSFVLIITAISFTADNLFKFSKGFFAAVSDENTSATNSINIETNDKTTDLDISKAADNNNTDTDSADVVLYPVRPKKGEEIGELYIKKINATLPIYEGTNEDELEKGVGHYEGSVLPGENDNAVLAGHRDTVFRKLGKVGKGDLLIVRTSAGEFKYKVKKVRIVDKEDRTVIVPKPSTTLTVSTCYPFDYIGSAPKRYILVAYLADKTLN
ncbi:class D sortase [Anaerocolumna sp. MB42-C2]|uniref:class D sortase n=1 Tax=Anaerocolumna sp. MB42-C2 TaxID=3070997 RepID=UPI0027E1E02F|nr:class D sortase [Anaerocolumna sp. MB42-C2]WMJ87196.1 class D sortase [Anaerocolumna sp. MB42-C2]